MLLNIPIIQKVIAYLISDEIENIKANFFTKLSTWKNHNSLELTEFTPEELKEFVDTIIKVNPVTAFSFYKRF